MRRSRQDIPDELFSILHAKRDKRVAARTRELIQTSGDATEQVAGHVAACPNQHADRCRIER
jgi:hypothetical protein